MSIESKEILELHSIYQNLQESEKTKSCPNGTTVAAGKPCPSDKTDDKDNEKKGNGFNVKIPIPFLKRDINVTGNRDGAKAGIQSYNPKDNNEKGSTEKIEVINNKNGDKNGETKDNNNNNNTVDPNSTKNTNNKEIKVDKEEDKKPDYRSDSQKKIDSMGKMSNLEKKNRLRFGNEKVDFLKQKQVDFKTMQAMSQMPGADRKAEKLKFINKYPNSITAQKYHGLRDHLEWDAFDMVGSYLMDSRQADSMDEALYVMMEMDSSTIQNIVQYSEFELSEARRADKKGIKRGEKGNPDTDQAPSGQQAADTKTGYKARRVERREGDKRRKANKERRGWNYGGKEAAAGDLANAQRQPDADLGSQKQVTDTGAHKDKHGWRQRVSSPASGRKSESASSKREDDRYPPQNPKHKLHGKKVQKDKPQGRYKEVKENYAAVEAIRLLIEKQNKAAGNKMADNVGNAPNRNSAGSNKNADAPNAQPKNNGTIEDEINQIQTMPALPEKDVKKFLDAGETKNAPSKESKPINKDKGTKKPNRTNVGGRWYNNNLDGANDLPSNSNVA